MPSSYLSLDADGKGMSIPTDRQPQDLGEIDVVNYAGKDKAASEKAQSEVGSKTGSKKGSVAGM